MSRLIKRVPADYVFAEGDEGKEPPLGDAYQVWQDVSEESPMSPVFVDRTDCAAWLVENEECSPAAAEKFIDQGWAPSFIGSGFGLFSGVQSAAGVGVHIEWLHEQAGHPATIAPGARIRHLESGVEGTAHHRFPPPDGGSYYFVTWDRGLPSLLDENPQDDPNAPMDAGCRGDGFEVIEAPVGRTADALETCAEIAAHERRLDV